MHPKPSNGTHIIQAANVLMVALCCNTSRLFLVVVVVLGLALCTGNASTVDSTGADGATTTAASMDSSSGSDDTVVYIYDLTPTLTMAPADAYETVQLVAALGGIVNRNGPRLYQMYTSVDPMWLEYVPHSRLCN